MTTRATLVTARCRGITVSNPNAQALDVCVETLDENVDVVSSTTTAAGRADTTIPWTEPNAIVAVNLPDTDLSATFFVDALPVDVAEELVDVGLDVPQSC